MVRQYFQARLQFRQYSINLIFDSEALAQRANKRLYLGNDLTNPAIGEVHFIRDDSVEKLIRKKGAANSVILDRTINSDGRRQLILKAFNEFTVCLLFG